MLGRNTIDLPLYPTNNPQTEPTYLTPKNYAPFQRDQRELREGREQQREPDHVAIYSLHPHSHPLRPSPNAGPINRNPYINPPPEPRRDPPKQVQTLTRNSSFKEAMPARQSQELVRTKTESLKNGHKTSVSGSKLYNPNLRADPTPNSRECPMELTVNYSQTVDLGSISRNQGEWLAAPLSPEEELLKMRLQYLEILEQEFREFEAKKSVELLKSLQDSNRLFLIRNWEEIGKLKEERSRKTISDCASESDNLSEDAFSVEDRSDIRNNSLRVQGEKRKFIEGFSRSREKSSEKESEIAAELKLQEKLMKEYEEESKREAQNGELDKLEKSIRSLEVEIAKTNSKNEQIEVKLQSYPFFNEWKMMCTEAEGARKMDVALKAELKKRKDRLREVKENGLPKKDLSEEKRRTIILDEESRAREGSLSKNRLPTMKIQATPINRSQNSSLHESSTNRQQQPSLKLVGMGQQSRTKSVNRSSN